MGVVGCSVRDGVVGNVLSGRHSLVFDPDIKTKLLHFISSISWCFCPSPPTPYRLETDDEQFCLQIGRSTLCA